MQNSDKFRKGLNAYSLDYSQFLKSCMLKADFVTEDVYECHEAYKNFATLALRIELRRLNRLVDAYKSSVEVPSDGSDLALPKFVEEEGRMKKAIFNFHIEAASFVVTCMQKGGFEPEETDECDAMHLKFMSLVLESEISRLKQLTGKDYKTASIRNEFFQVITSDSKTDGIANSEGSNEYIRSSDQPSKSSTDNEKSSTTNGLSKIKTLQLSCDSLSRLNFGTSESNENEYVRNSVQSSKTSSVHKSSPAQNAPLQKTTLQLNSISRTVDFSTKGPKEYLRNSVQISKSSLFTVYHARDSQGSLAIKVLNTAGTDNQHLTKIQNEYVVCSKLHHPGIRKVLTRATIEGKEALFLEWFEGRTMTQCGKFSVNLFLEVAKNIVLALEGLHSQKMIHGNLTTENILFDFNSYSVKLIGFSSTSKWNNQKATSSVGECNKLGSDVRFMSPEQTGLMGNRSVDYRSDYYSLGIIFYSMLFGSAPYNSEKMSDVIYMHLFSDAAPLHRVDDSIPEVLSNFVAKLMKKDAEDRYRSTEGILA